MDTIELYFDSIRLVLHGQRTESYKNKEKIQTDLYYVKLVQRKPNIILAVIMIIAGQL